jgi:pectin methylesterase-like acyl-CoA thioesterase
VDFICGAGDVYFNRCLIVTEKRNEDGTGKNVIAAPRTSTTKWGYVFDHCTIRNDVSLFALARGWHTHPRCAWLNTTLETPGKLIPTRFEPQGIRSVDNEFFEYHTMDAEGNVITPSSNVVEFVVNDDCRYIETVFSEKEAKKYTIKNMFPKWRPDKKTRHLEKQIARIKKQYLKTAL